jgi:hypothetical protein
MLEFGARIQIHLNAFKHDEWLGAAYKGPGCIAEGGMVGLMWEDGR